MSYKPKHETKESTEIVKYANSKGGFATRIEGSSVYGIPDILITALPNGGNKVLFFIEHKKEKGTISLRQVGFAKEVQKTGNKVFYTFGKRSAIGLIDAIIAGNDVDKLEEVNLKEVGFARLSEKFDLEMEKL